MPRPHITSVLKALQIPTHVQSVFLVGSRLWGTHSSKSDFDLLIVVSDPTPSTAQWQKSQHKDQYDATVLNETEFRDQVKEGSLIETLCCLIPDDEECVLLHDKAHNRRKLIGKGHFPVLRSWAEERRKKDCEKAMKFWAKGGAMRDRGWKILQHSITAECILQGLQTIIEDADVDLRDVVLTQEDLQRIVAMGRKEDDRAWLGLDWTAVEKVHRERIRSLNTTRINQ